MTDTIARAAAPKSFWIIAVLGLLWNAFGGYDYTMTMTRNTAYLSQMGDPQEIIHWVEAFPLWAQMGYGFGVWGSVAGSLLMLLRSRHAVSAFAVSFAGAVVSFASQTMNALPASLDTAASKAMPLVILAVVALFWWYCRKQTAAGVLR